MSNLDAESEQHQAQLAVAAALVALQRGDLHEAGALVLKHAIETTASQYGFFSIAMEGPFERLLNHQGFEWDATTNRKFYDDAMQSYAESGHLDFRNVTNLAGRAITHNEVVLANSPSTDRRAAGTPAGHPPLNSFLGIPFRKDGEVAAVIGLANRAGGYSVAQQDAVELLAPASLAIAEHYHRVRVERQAAQREGAD